MCAVRSAVQCSAVQCVREGMHAHTPINIPFLALGEGLVFAHRVFAAAPRLPRLYSLPPPSLSGKADWFVRLVAWLLWLKQRGAGVWAMYVQLLPQVRMRVYLCLRAREAERQKRVCTHTHNQNRR